MISNTLRLLQNFHQNANHWFSVHCILRPWKFFKTANSLWVNRLNTDIGKFFFLEEATSMLESPVWFFRLRPVLLQSFPARPAWEASKAALLITKPRRWRRKATWPAPSNVKRAATTPDRGKCRRCGSRLKRQMTFAVWKILLKPFTSGQNHHFTF